MKDAIKLTGLWKNAGKDGKSYLSGNLTPGSKLMVFPNGFKKGEKDPDFVVYLVPNKKEKENEKAPEPEVQF